MIKYDSEKKAWDLTDATDDEGRQIINMGMIMMSFIMSLKFISVEDAEAMGLADKKPGHTPSPGTAGPINKDDFNVEDYLKNLANGKFYRD